MSALHSSSPAMRLDKTAPDLRTWRTSPTVSDGRSDTRQAGQAGETSRCTSARTITARATAPARAAKALTSQPSRLIRAFTWMSLMRRGRAPRDAGWTARPGAGGHR